MQEKIFPLHHGLLTTNSAVDNILNEPTAIKYGIK